MTEVRIDNILEGLSDLEPEEAAGILKEAVLKIWPTLDEEAHKTFLMSLTEEAATDKVASLVHL